MRSRIGNQDEPTTPNIQAYANNIPENSIDCGIVATGWCSGSKCIKLATMTAFVIILTITGLIQGIIETYFRISAKQVAIDFDFDTEFLDWLLVSNGIFQGIFAIIITYYAEKIHQMSWLGGLIIAESIACILLTIPTLSHLSEFHITEMTDISKLCVRISPSHLITESTRDGIITATMLFVLQLGISLGNIAFITVIGYMDDNGDTIKSPYLIGVIFSGKIFGSLIAILMSFGLGKISNSYWWVGWLILGPTLFICGIILTLFPRKLPKTVVQEAASRIEETVSPINIRPPKFLYDVNLIPSLYRLLSNKILLLNISAWILIQTATNNYILQEQKYIQSRFFLQAIDNNGLTTEINSRFFSYLLRPPFIAISVLCVGLLISHVMFKARSLIIWNIIIGLIAIGFYIVYVFLKCGDINIVGAYSGNIIRSLCSQGCTCSSKQFLPVCPENSLRTYYSPCFAGCTGESFLNDIKTYENCSCGTDSEYVTNTKATEGVCNFHDCYFKSQWYQILSILAAGLIGTSLIGRIIITIRSVLEQDKCLALALAISLTELITYVPGKFLFDYISQRTCQYWSTDHTKCYLHESPIHGDLLNYVSIGFISFAIILDLILWFFVKELNCYPNDNPINNEQIPLERQVRDNEIPGESDDENASMYRPSPINNSPIIGTNYAEIDYRNHPETNRKQFNRSNTIENSPPSSTADEAFVSANNSDIGTNGHYAEIDFSRRNQIDDHPLLNFQLQTPDSDAHQNNVQTLDHNNKSNKNETKLETDF